MKVLYSVALDYSDGADKAIRDLRMALFALASTIQANSKAVAAIDHTLRIDLYEREGASGTFLLAIEDPETTSIALRDGPAGQNVAQEIVAVLCATYPDACKQPARGTLDLYRCRKGSCPGRIRFGSFPSDSVNENFSLAPPRHARAKWVHLRQRPCPSESG